MRTLVMTSALLTADGLFHGAGRLAVDDVVDML